jgi:hypothetical protein
VDQGTTQCTLRATYLALQTNGAISILPGLRLRKQSSLLMSYGIHQHWRTTTKASLKTADELTSTGSKKLAAPPCLISKVPVGYPTLPRRNVKEHSFNIGDLVLRRIKNTEGLHKLSSPWEVPSQWQR